MARANAAAARDGLTNVRFEVANGPLPEASCDLVCVFDAFHHLTRPEAALDAIRSALRGGGSLLIAEAAVSGDPGADAADPTAILTYGSNLVYCLQEGLAGGGAGLGATWSGQGLGALLADHGFGVEATYVSPVGYRVSRHRHRDPVATVGSFRILASCAHAGHLRRDGTQGTLAGRPLLGGRRDPEARRCHGGGLGAAERERGTGSPPSMPQPFSEGSLARPMKRTTRVS